MRVAVELGLVGRLMEVMEARDSVTRQKPVTSRLLVSLSASLFPLAHLHRSFPASSSSYSSPITDRPSAYPLTIFVTSSQRDTGRLT
jgi:hypothetical protein